MEFSLVFLGNRDRKKFLEEISSKIKLIYSSYQVVFLTNKIPDSKLLNINKYINFKTIIFGSSATNEEMFETFVQKTETQTIILFKENTRNINFNDINKMIDRNQKGDMLIVSKQSKKPNILMKIFKSVKDFFTRIFLGVRLFNGEGDIILLDKTLISTMKEMPGKSAVLTKINCWAGIEPKYITIAEQPKQKIKYSTKDLLPIIIILSIFLLFIIIDIILGVLAVTIPFIWLFLLVVIQIVIFALVLYYFTKIMFNIQYGSMRYIPQARIINETDNFDE